MCVSLSLSPSLSLYIYIYIYIYGDMIYNLREFGVQTTVIAAPLRWVGLLPAVLGPGPVGTHVAQTLRFSRFIAPPLPRSHFKRFGLKIVLSLGLAYMYSPDHGFYRLDRPLALSGPKVCTIIALLSCTFWKRL